MSLFPAGLTLILAAAEGLLNPVFFLPRSIGGFVADVTIEEQHQDQLVITEHPVEQGADVTDHAFKKQAQLVVRCGYSNSSIQADGNSGYVREVYEDFLELQASREPFDVVTGKRFYTNMLIENLACTTDEKTEHALLLTVALKEIIIAETQVVTVPPASAQASPEITNGTQRRGNITVTPTSSYNEANPNPAP